jgi:chromatin segregation and condensation protein Rec8/ScpA/Scc1 (kleisin family)
LLDEAVRRYLLVVAPRRSGTLEKFFEKVELRCREEGIQTLSEYEAMQLANEELQAMRRERRESEAGR